MMIRVDGLVLYVRLGDFVWGRVGVRNLCYNQAQFFIELVFNSPHKLFCFCILFMLVLFSELGCTLVIFS